MRAIDADDLLYNLEGMMAVSPTGYIHGDTIVDMIGDAPTIEPQQRWIPCSERLPEQPNPNPELEGKPLDIYLVCKQDNIPFRAFWNGRNFTDGWTSLDVDAWMPLPESYKEGEG